MAHVRRRNVTGVTRPYSPCGDAPRVDRVKASVASTVVTALLVGCLGAPVEQGFFFPTWSAEGEEPAGQVLGTLIEDDRCLYVEANDQRTLVVWEDGMGFENGALLDASGLPIAQVGEVIHDGGGYYDSRSHIENLSGESIPERCIPDRASGDRFAIIYEVGAGPLD
jgi:hypothetical protein